MKKPLVLPDFKNEDEERDFWSHIDLSEYLEPSDFKKVTFPNLKRTKRLLSIRVDEALIEKAKKKAAKLHIPYQTLMRQILHQGLEAK
jgi:predicted DNA binding CopG/RHH family protein